MRRTARVLFANEILLVSQATLVFLLLYFRIGLVVGASPAIGVLGGSAFVAGIGIRIGIEALRRRLGEYLRMIASASWILTTLRLIVITLLGTAYVYTALKVHVPLLNARLFDRELWELDSAMFLGHSPSVFLLNLFENHFFLVLIDRVYGYVFLTVVLVSLPVVLTMVSDSVRIAFVTGQVILWSAGAWLYLALPSLGPCYVFYAVWDPFRAQLSNSSATQALLFRNYQLVLNIRNGIVSPQIDLTEGIGAFPSLHVGFVVYVTLWLFRHSRKSGLAGCVVSFAMFLGSVLTGWHYMADSLAGIVLAVVCWLFSLRVERYLAAEEKGRSTAAPK